MVAARRNRGAASRGTGSGAPHGAVWQTAAMPDDPTAPADLVLLGGALRTMVPASPRAEALAVRDGRIVAVGSDEDVRGHIGPRTRVVELGGRTVTPGFQDAHIHPMEAGLEALRCNLHDLPRSRRLPRRHRRLRGEPSRRGVDHGRRLVAGRLSGRHAARRGPRPRRPGPAGLPPEQRRARGLGEHARPRARRHHRGNPRPGRRPDRARPGRHADGNAARGCRGARGTAHPARHRRGPARRARARPARAAPARDHRLAGRLGAAADDRGLSPVRGAGPADRARRRRPLVGSKAWPRADRGVARPPGARLVRPLPGHERQAVARRDRRELHRRDARPVPGRRRDADRTTAASTSSTPRSWPMP